MVFGKFDIYVFINVASGVLFGGIITLLVVRKFYKKADKDLDDKTKKLKLVSELIIYKLQYPDAQTEIKMDDDGDVIGLKFMMSGSSKSESKVSGKITNSG
jgi:hypothetical protein